VSTFNTDAQISNVEKTSACLHRTHTFVIYYHLCIGW